MANTNPFMVGDDLIEDEITNVDRIDKSTVEEKESFPPPEFVTEVEGTSFDQIALKLLKENFVLTALEFHTELVESGRELPRLRDFFSNPANFERTKLNESSPPGLRELWI